ncbi:MAG: glycosyltransferase family 39 protein [Nitrospirae bacterium]|nr:glycosyltransferase family 39 protein [Nitrospirota bacterium]
MSKPTNFLAIAALLVVLAAGFWIRLAGAPYGLPVVTNTDELPIAMNAARIAATGDMNPRFFNYPSLTIYLDALCFKALFLAGKAAGKYQSMGQMQQPDLLYAGRVITVVLGTATLALAFAAGRLLWGTAAGLAAAALLAFCYLHATLSYVIGVDVPTAFFATAALLAAALRWRRGPRWRYYLASGVLAGLAMGSKYTALFAVLPLAAAHLAAPDDPRPLAARLRDPRLLAVLGLTPLVFLATTPYAVLDWPAFLQALRVEGAHYAGGHAGSETGGVSYGAYLGVLAREFGILPLALAALGGVLVAVRERRLLWVLLAFPLAYFLFIGRYPVYFARNLAPVVPFLALLGGAALHHGRRLAAARGTTAARAATLAMALLVAAGAVQQGTRAWHQVRLVTLPDTRWQSLLWAAEHLPAGARILREPHTPNLGQIVHPTRPGPRFLVMGVGWSIATVSPRAVGLFDFVVLSSAMYERFVDHPEKYPAEAARYRELFEDNRLVAAFKADNRTLSGPEIRIYALRHGQGNPP